ncbi:patatin-like phospholipase family protein [Nocardioides bruguierae]|uniref:Patatin-like phospholipase family protein n=1 Tax=Nocardioides bruguierae TaxID=2945102 RepID=A0A9X2ID95_9ACTN|nr:patatin-like phospholipase family protein [Nocardioides bruguierae]MCM0619506.1 patatin-like phospholipase family protein [Nocardioides bruguierae]
MAPQDTETDTDTRETHESDAYGDPRLECDLVMKGGVTSGVIYPGVACTLARVYRFRSVGGSSAGAIAAAATAAAELGRASGGFEKLDALAGRLTARGTGGRSLLFRLFRPVPEQRRLFGVLTAGLGRTGAARWVATAAAVGRGYALRLLLAAVLPLGLVVAGVLAGGVLGLVLVPVAALLLLVGLAAVGVGSGVLADVRRIERFGLVSGMPGPRGGEALTPWLHERLQDLAGRGPGDPVLTFGDLRAAGVRLRVMTTDLTRGYPVTMPWPNREHWCDPDEMAQLFPADVVQHLVRVGGGAREDGLVAWPEPDDLPVVVATRMSLSFPGLIQAVPLHAVDHARAGGADGAAPRPVWFSDGGICANLPVHLFDSPLPRRPTFAINLEAFGDVRRQDAEDEGQNSYLPLDAGAGRYRPRRHLDPAGVGGLLGFLGAIVGTARTWVDNQQLTMPGYRNRVVTIFHSDSEGGLNLDMPAEVVEALGARGRGAGRKLVDAFAGPEPGSVDGPAWTAHRWTRLRISVAGLADWWGAFARSFRDADVGRPDYPGLLAAHADEVDLPYRLSATDRALLAQRLGRFVAEEQQWDDGLAGRHAPRPAPELRLVTDMDTTAEPLPPTGIAEPPQEPGG